MPTRHLNPRASGLIVFGGGGGDAPAAPAAAPAAAPSKVAEAGALPSRGASQSAVSSAGKDPGTWSHYQNMLWSDGTEVGMIKNSVTGATQAGSGRMAQGNKGAIAKVVANLLLQMNKPHEDWKVADAAAKAKVVADKKKADEDAAAKKKAEDKRISAEKVSEETGAAASDLTKRVFTDPDSVVKKSDVATIDPNAPGTVIDPSVGQLTGPVAQMEVPGLKAGAPTFENFVSGNYDQGFYRQPMDMYRGREDAARQEYNRRYMLAPSVDTAATPDQVTTDTIDASKVTEASTTALEGVETKQGDVSTEAQVTAATMDPATTAVSNLTAAQGESTILNNPVTREIQAGEIISGAADAEKASAFTEQIQAATATPSDKATVQGQLSGLMQDFEGGNTPPWASGAMRAATAAMAQRGLGSSSMAGQAIIQATMEAALPIAMADAQTLASFEAQNLSNRQQRAMLGAQQRAAFMGQEFDQAFQSRVQNASRVSEVANMNFTADQQIALENSRTSNTMNLANLNNKQAMVMAQAASISGLEMANLSNQQQAAVQNAQAFLQMDLTNLSNSQQTELFKAQAIQQALLTDNASENAAKQFNATSENQTKQFMSSLNSQVTQFNASQKNAMTQFREGETNAASKFNATMREQRSQFNSANSLVIAQANAQWRQNATTLNTAAQNTANMEFAKQINGLTNKSIDEIWQRERDMMDMYFNSEEKKKDRITSLILGDKSVEAARIAAEAKSDTADGAAKTNLLFKLFWPF